MNRHIIQLFSFLALISFSSLAFSTFAFAENSCGDASTNLINCDVGGTGMIYTIVNTIINILTASVGVIATIGILVWFPYSYRQRRSISRRYRKKTLT